MIPLVCIVGQTATGKTSFALQLSEVIPSEIVSADSRQVYKKMTVGTGKDIPTDFSFTENSVLSYFQNKKTKLWMLDLVQPDEDWSASQFVKTADTILLGINSRQRLPIVVGGTGMYVESLLNPPASLSIPKDDELRESLSFMNVDELQQHLLHLDRKRFEQMNRDDQMNPRRLVRAIEVAQWGPSAQKTSEKYHTMIIGFRTSPEKLEQKIRQRVLERLNFGMLEEVQSLLKEYGREGFFRFPSFSATGYRETLALLENEISKEECLERWTKREVAYAKRQMTWFKKRPNITWIDLDSFTPNEQGKLVNRLKTWYSAHI
ncbi:MAG: tRNA dimethylallyltransferase [Microgenomates group bacterium GW2011_GWF2_45_18]|nr:MAG: tRNA dimethylallyltransferase [Microgenomates group bacterium GW2011_GWF1_44_10]KKU02000.1 MAG: tRNA dimethylallyltransferase [Microgenomates group bacterium GW2011_GWF2_45_18]OGJ41186.1 MAG: tRNA (adenosine(37)-N6)-dimethylallyltransferase MiaA [Candidatus Pacebacteria bacterium RIFOXYB1_FULL_44_10]HAU99014.1 tRNA (adenosine(37)-N6)-dimethylallyltransferase MiaA [Candidatus Paceibacterota bacterium]HAX01272.1 tRNA (adenosine(37)-N6)-dimethylallyltransferase MiaA [Candidatus Paceibacter